jgi:hypothetical protein
MANNEQVKLMASMDPIERAEYSWGRMEPVIYSICSPSARAVSISSYMDCYTEISNYCVNTSHSHIDASGGVAIAGSDLYYKLRGFLVKYIQSLQQAATMEGEQLLIYYSTRWEMFMTSSKILHNLFSYINRMWIKRSIDENNVSVSDVNTVTVIN